MRLPDELLQDIIYRVVPRHSFYNPAGRPDHYAPYVALTKTCRRFHRLATPMMYSGLNICIGSESISPYFDKYPVEVMRKLLRSFEENSHLGEFCERLNIMLRHERRLELDHWDDPEMPEFPLAADAEVEVEMITALAALLTGTKSVEIIGDIHRYKEIWTILRTASANMPRLETVRLNEYGGAAYGPICDSVSRAGTLKCLDVSLVGETTGASQAITKVSSLTVLSGSFFFPCFRLRATIPLKSLSKSNIPRITPCTLKICT